MQVKVGVSRPIACILEGPRQLSLACLQGFGFPHTPVNMQAKVASDPLEMQAKGGGGGQPPNYLHFWRSDVTSATATATATAAATATSSPDITS